MTGKAIQKWSDEAMFAAEEAVKSEFGYRPTVRLLDAPNDPLGKLAYIAKAYQGVFPEDYSYITDEDRKYYIQDMEKNILGMPSEAVQFHFLLENVTRSFTHQLVRTRHASYAQESMRFAVKEDFPVQLPPSLLGTESLSAWFSTRVMDGYLRENASDEEYDEHVERYASDKQKMRFKWDQAVSDSGSVYADLIEMGMPAEDARGLAPHAIVTKINWVVDLRALMATAGQRLCTQAQWEHREMWNSLIASIRDYGSDKTYLVDEKALSSEWQFDLLADRFKPVCYQTGRCQFRSDFDRYCNIRDRVETNASVGRPSSDWHKDHFGEEGFDHDPSVGFGFDLGTPTVPAIHPSEWLSPGAAIRPDAEWRSDESLKNIQGRRR